MADLIVVEGGARNPKVPTLFQVADVDSVVVRWVDADLVTHIDAFRSCSKSVEMERLIDD
jgi:bisphosphoglycerate-independent phosphoglycerate mutase (AlkP superfamily)